MIEQRQWFWCVLVATPWRVFGPANVSGVAVVSVFERFLWFEEALRLRGSQ